MPIEVAIWRIDDIPEKVPFSTLETEKKLEDVLHKDISVLDDGLLIVGRQVLTGYGKYIDLLALDAEGDLVVIELKRNKTPREVVAQLLDYASWVHRLGYESIEAVFAANGEQSDIQAAFQSCFGRPLPEKLNTDHRLIVVSAGLDPESERIIEYLSENFGVPINAVFFKYFRIGSSEYLTRTWLIDPAEAEIQSANASTSKKVHGVWNQNDFFVNVGESSHRKWEDCREYGFIAAGQSKWASSRLSMLEPGHRIFACISGVGYVGVGTVVGSTTAVKNFKVKVNGQDVALLDLPLRGNMKANSDNPDLTEYVVPIQWIKSVPAAEAYWETGMFANQNPACKLRDTSTLDRLASHFKVSVNPKDPTA